MAITFCADKEKEMISDKKNIELMRFKKQPFLKVYFSKYAIPVIYELPDYKKNKNTMLYNHVYQSPA